MLNRILLYLNNSSQITRRQVYLQNVHDKRREAGKYFSSFSVNHFDFAGVFNVFGSISGRIWDGFSPIYGRFWGSPWR